jgi:hypothetical protein
LIDNNTAAYYETAYNDPDYVGISNRLNSPIYILTNQPAQPIFDPIVVTGTAASRAGNQLLVQWQMPDTSSPQFAYQIKVYTNASHTGTIVGNAYAIEPEVRQQLLTLTNAGAATVYPRLTIIDLFDQTNPPIDVTVTTATLQAATSVPNAVSGLNFTYYQSASSYTLDTQTNWITLPNFAALTPVLVGAVSGLDLTPRLRRNGYAFNFAGYLNVTNNGLYTFTLNSCDGSQLYVDGQLVVDWNGKHNSADAGGWLGLQAGLHTLQVQYFFDVQPSSLFPGEYFDQLSLSYAGPGFGLTAIPSTAFYRVPAANEPAINLTSPIDGSVSGNVTVPLNATVTANGNTVNQVQFLVGDSLWAQVTNAPYSTNAFFWATTNNPVRARLIYNGTNVIDSTVGRLTTTNVTLTPWELAQAFYHNTPNGAAIQNSTYSLIGDGVNLLTRQVTGDCTLIAHLANIPSATTAVPGGSMANGWWQTGIILRGSTNMIPGSPLGGGGAAFTTVYAQPNGGTYFIDESYYNAGDNSAYGYSGGQKWFKLQRAGDVFTIFASGDGLMWTVLHTSTLTDFPETIYAGFFTYASPSSNPNAFQASFDNASIVGDVAGPLSVSVGPDIDNTKFVGQGTTFIASPIGEAPFSYQWQLNGQDLLNATNATLVLTNLQAPDSGRYSVTLSNLNGTASAWATLRVLPALPVVSQVLVNDPGGYWSLNETTGPTAYDVTGNYNGTGEGGITFGIPSMTNAPFKGFGTNNLAARFNGTDSDIAIPPFNYVTTNFTITGWVRCDGAQTSWSGLVYSRGSSAVGIMVVNNGSNLELHYSWYGSDYNFSTGLNLPTDGRWAFVALTIEPSRSIVYLATLSTLQSATNNVANIGRTLDGSFYFGCDILGSRRLNGALDEVAIYNRTLSYQQIKQILTASQAAMPPVVNLSSPVAGRFVAPATLTLTANVITNGYMIGTLQFYNGKNLLGNADANGNFIRANVPVGNYTVYAQVTYNGTSVASSAPALITVGPASVRPILKAAPVLQNGSFSLSGSGIAGQSYILLMTSNLLTPTWTPLFTNLADANGVFTFSDAKTTSSPQRFYKIQQAQ